MDSEEAFFSEDDPKRIEITYYGARVGCYKCKFVAAAFLLQENNRNEAAVLLVFCIDMQIKIMYNIYINFRVNIYES